MDNKNIKKFYQLAPRPFNYVPNDLVDSSPSIPPTMSGLMRINPATGDIWVSAGNTLVSDWKLITGGGGGTSLTLQTNGTDNGDQTLLNLFSSDGSISLASDGAGGVDFSVTAPNIPAKKIEVAGTDETVILTTTLATLGNVEMPALLGYTYSFRIFCAFDIDDTGYATRWAVKAPDTTPIYLGYSTSAPGSTIGAFIYNSSVTTFGGTTNAAGTTVSATGNIAIIEGIYTPSEDTTLRITVTNEGQAGSTNLTLKAGSYIEYYELAL